MFWSRYVGAMLLHAFSARAGAGTVLAAAAGPADVALLSAVSMCFALGAATTEQFKHLAAAEAGPLAGLQVLPGLRALRPALAAIAGRADPLRVQSMFASAMLAADPVLSGVYYVDDHFVPYTGAKPVALQILTSDFDACPAEILFWLKSRWREENFLKYASANYGIDKICDYLATIETNTKIVDNPARKAATATVREADKALAGAERELAGLLSDPAISPAAKNKAIPALQEKITRARQAAAAATAARSEIPAKLPASAIDPDAKVALLRAGRRSLQMVLRLLAHNAEHWLSNQLNAYLRDDDEYRAITRQTIIRGLAGTITFTSAAITVQLEQPGPPRIARALSLLIQEINATPPAMPGDTRPITYQIVPQPGI